jgi:hypothetical protein
MVHGPARASAATHAPSQASQPSETSQASQYLAPRASATAATAATSEGHVKEEEDEEGKGEGEEEEDGAESAFQVVPTLAGHRFQGAAAGATLPSRHFITHVRKEWKLLRSSLPTGIHIRVSEERMDLMRAVIIGQRHIAHSMLPEYNTEKCHFIRAVIIATRKACHRST